MPSIELTIRNDPAEQAVVREALDRFAIAHPIPEKALIELHVVLDEIVGNVIKYAWPEGGMHEVQIRLTVDEAGAELEILDDGRPYDPSNAPAPPHAGRPERRARPGGLGIHLVKQLVDRFEYRRLDGQNQLKLIKRFASGMAPGRGRADDQERA